MNAVRTVSLILPVLMVPGALAASWETVRAITPESGVLVRVRDSLAPRGVRLVRGRFAAADAESVTVRTKDSSLRSIQRNRVLLVKARLPPRRRTAAWIATGGAVIAFIAVTAKYWPHTDSKKGIVGFSGAVTLPAIPIAFRLSRWNTLYRP